ncbi:MAG: DNA-binding protein [Streptococcaceae bacterium]|nr:DNA-binding protein [Streptococcaceae bacterium]
MKIKYIPVEHDTAEWCNKKGLIKRFEGLNINTLNHWLVEMRDSSKFSQFVINPTHKLVWIHINGFVEFLKWKQRNKVH